MFRYPKYQYHHHATTLSPGNASLAFTSSPLHCLHLRQNPFQIIQDDDSFKVQVLYSLEILNGTQRPTEHPDFLWSKKKQQKPGICLESTACLFPTCALAKPGRTQLLHTGPKSVFSWVMGFSHFTTELIRATSISGAIKWHLHTPACKCPGVSAHCSGSMSPPCPLSLRNPIDNESPLTA